MPFAALNGVRSMPTSAAASSSSVSHGRDSGRSGGFRAILLFRRSERCFFVFGFAKSSRDNLRRDELKAFRLLADEMLGMDQAGLRAVLSNGTITEVICHG